VQIRFLEIQGPNCREIFHRPLPKATLVCKKKKKKKNPEGEGAPAPEHQVFPISIMETVLNRLLLASL